MRGAELCHGARSSAPMFSTARGSPKHPGCPAGRELLPDPLAVSRRAVGCCWETPGVLPPQLILGCVQLIMEREGITASPAFASSPLHPVCAAAGFGGAGARHSLILWVWAEEPGEILWHSPLPPVSFKRLRQPWEGCYLLLPQFLPCAWHW